MKFTLINHVKTVCKVSRGRPTLQFIFFVVSSLRSWRYCVGTRLKFWRRSRVAKKGSRDGGFSACDSSAVMLITTRPQNRKWCWLANDESYCSGVEGVRKSICLRRFSPFALAPLFASLFSSLLLSPPSSPQKCLILRLGRGQFDTTFTNLNSVVLFPTSETKGQDYNF